VLRDHLTQAQQRAEQKQKELHAEIIQERNHAAQEAAQHGVETTKALLRADESTEKAREFAAECVSLRSDMIALDALLRETCSTLDQTQATLSQTEQELHESRQSHRRDTAKHDELVDALRERLVAVEEEVDVTQLKQVEQDARHAQLELVSEGLRGEITVRSRDSARHSQSHQALQDEMRGLQAALADADAAAATAEALHASQTEQLKLCQLQNRDLEGALAGEREGLLRAVREAKQGTFAAGDVEALRAYNIKLEAEVDHRRRMQEGFPALQEKAEEADALRARLAALGAEPSKKKGAPLHRRVQDAEARAEEASLVVEGLEATTRELEAQRDQATPR